MSIISIGNFDGVHLGHQKILGETVKLAKIKNVKSFAFSIMYPYNYYKNNFEGLIYSIDIRIEKILNCGIERIITADLSEIGNMEPEDFIKMLLKKGASGVVVGEDFRFGKRGSGNKDTLENLSGKYNFDLKIINDVKEKNHRVSSSIIKKYIQMGDINEINSLLGSPYILYGKIIKRSDKTILQRSFEKLVDLKNGDYLFEHNKKEVKVKVINGEYLIQSENKFESSEKKIELKAIKKIF